MKNNRETCLNILNAMVERGYHLMGTAERLVDMMDADVDFFTDMAMKFDEWNDVRG